VIKNLKKLKEANLLDLVEIRMTVMPEDLPYLKESIISIAELGVKYIAPVPVTDVNWTPNDFVIFEKTLKDVWEWYFEKCENGEEDLHIKLIDDYLENVLWSALNENQKKICSAGTKFSCSIGVEGDILPCHQRHTIKEKYEDLVIGNILKDSEIKTVDFNNETINGFFECNDCIANPVCKGGCPSENLTKNNNGNQLNEIQCLIYMTMVKVAIDFQEKLLNMNPKNERLKIVSENLKLLKNLFEITETKDISKLQNLVEKIEINKEIILPRFNEIIRKICFSLTQHL
jgi:radical SAM protein with 4Fe4S-binding SPASM domain